MDQCHRDFPFIPVLEYGEGQDIDAVNAAALSNKLQQMANGAVYDESGNVRNIHDRKLDALEDLIESANGKPLLVAYFHTLHEQLYSPR